MAIPKSAAIATLEYLFEVNNDVHFIHLTFVTYANVHRTTIVTRARALEMAAKPGQGLSVGQGVHYLSTPHGGWVSDLYQGDNGGFTPDWNSIRLFAGRPGHATGMCHLPNPAIESKDSSNTTTNSHSRDPRSVLSTLQAAATDKGLNFKVGFEVEFLLIPQSDLEEGKPEPTIGKVGGATAASMLNKSFIVLEESVLALEESGVEVWPAHQEDAKNHYEIALDPAEPLEAADNLVLATGIIKTIASKHGYVATMHPKPYEHGPGTGQHTHISICNGIDQHDDERTATINHALAATLKYLRPLRAFLSAGHDSYNCRDGEFGNSILAWSNWKQAPIRHIGDRLELRVPDALGNPYLQLAAVIGVMMHGVETKVPLTMKPVHHLEGRLPEDQWGKYGIKELLPCSLEESLKSLKVEEAKKLFPSILGKEMLDIYLRNKEEEIKQAGKMTFAERRTRLMDSI